MIDRDYLVPGELSVKISKIFDFLLEITPDMTPIYRRLLDVCFDTNKLCPTLYLHDENNIDYCPDILFLKNGCMPEKSMLSERLTYKHDSTSFGEYAFVIYHAALIVCNLLQIQCPLILPCELLVKLVDGVTIPNSKQRGKLILLQSGMGFCDTMGTLFHELRHVWQMEKHPKKFFSNYRIDYNDHKATRMQDAELDAEAFSVRMMAQLGFEAYPVRWAMDDVIDREIERRAKKMCFPGGANIPKYFADAIQISLGSKSM